MNKPLANCVKNTIRRFKSAPPFLFKGTKRTFLSLTLILLTMFFYVSCRKEKGIKNSQSEIALNQNPNGVLVTTPNLHYAYMQLKWVARALPELCKSNVFRYRMRYKLSLTNEWSENNDILDPYFNAFIPAYTYEVNAYNNINTVFSGTNDYHRDYFMGFVWDDCEYKTNIYIDDLEYCDTTKPLVVMPVGLDDSIGYYINSGHLDSLVINDENIDDYYMWYVRANSGCRDATAVRETCDGDGKCEPWLGETPQNCADCSGQGAGFTDYTLTLVSINTQTDLRDKRSSANWPDDEYQEKYLQWKYEVATQHYIYGPSTGINKASAIYNQIGNNWEDEPIGSGEKKRDILDRYKATGKNCQIKRTNINRHGRTKSNSGNPTLFTYNRNMCFRYDPTADEIAFLFYEFDDDANGFPSLPTNSPKGAPPFPGTWGTSTDGFPWTKTSSTVMHTIIPIGFGQWTSAGTTLVSIGGVLVSKNVFTKTINLDGEMTANFKIVEN